MYLLLVTSYISIYVVVFFPWFLFDNNEMCCFKSENSAFVIYPVLLFVIKTTFAKVDHSCKNMNLVLEGVLLLFLGNGFAIHGILYKRHHQFDVILRSFLSIIVLAANFHICQMSRISVTCSILLFRRYIMNLSKIGYTMSDVIKQ